MSEELRAWLGEIEERNPGPEPSRSDFDALILKVEELAGAIGECDEILDNMDVDFEASAYIAEVRTTLRAALRAPGGGEC